MQRDLSIPQYIPLTPLERGGFWIPAVTDLAIGVVDLETARENFNKNVLQPYLEEISRQISCCFKDTLGLLTAFSIFDPQKCRCPAIAQIWPCRIGEAPEILRGDN